MLAVGLRDSARQLLVGREGRAQSIRPVLASLVASAALAHSAWDLEYARDDPTVLIGRLVGDREVD